MAVGIVGLLALVAALYVLAPLRRPSVEAIPEPGPAEEAEALKHAALMGIVDLEEERDLGKLSQADFEVLRSEYERRALAALRAGSAADEAVARGGDADEGVAGGGDADDAALEVEIDAARARLRCSCGAPREPGKRCSSCGG